MTSFDATRERLFLYAAEQLGRGDAGGAVETLRRVLAEEPELAGAHALLAMALLECRRLYAAEVEAGLALEADPELPSAHLAMGMALMAQRRLRQAQRHVERAQELDPTAVGPHRIAAQLLLLRGETAAARRALERARELEPESPDVAADLGALLLDRGDLSSAEALARAALVEQPQHHEALILMGRLLLLRGQRDEAREHALWVLRQNANDQGAMRLLAETKASQSLWLGLWWRYAVWMSALGDKIAIALLLGTYVLYRVATIAAENAGAHLLANLGQLLWFALVVYTWVAPAVFRRALAREMAGVKLRADY